MHMGGPTPSTDTGDNTGGAPPARGSSAGYPGTPRWVKVSGIVALILILLVIVIMFVVGGSHGPSRHVPSASGSNYAAAASVAA
jgi:hypothetical protein